MTQLAYVFAGEEPGRPDGQGVVEITRQFPAWAYPTEDVVRIVRSWSVEEFGEMIAPRLHGLGSQEREEPKVIAGALQSWRAADTPTPATAVNYTKGWFLADLKRCEAYLHGRGLVPACDSWVDNVILSSVAGSRHMKEVADHIDVLDRVRIFTQREMVDAIRNDPSIVWIACGTQFGLDFGPGRSVLGDGRIVGVAGASALTNGYAGLSLYEWDAQAGRIGRLLVKFQRGAIVAPSEKSQ